MLPCACRWIATGRQSLIRCLSAKKPVPIANDANEPVANRSKKIYDSPLVNLIYPDGKKMDVVPLTEAERISRRRHLQLVKINDAANRKERDDYKLMDTKEFVAFGTDGDVEMMANAEESDKKEKEMVADDKQKMKERKTLALHSRMGANDIATKLKNVQKWIEKTHPVSIVITATDGNPRTAENIYDTIVKTIGNDGRPVQKLLKNNTLKFQILPTRCLKKK